MAKKQFKAESKRLMELMINSIYTNKEIFLREIISNASDAIDKLYYKSLTDKKIKVNKEDFNIFITIDKDKRTLTISDNGIGMTKEELENNLGTIAKSGSFDFKSENKKKENIDIIGQFGVGFYSAFMVAGEVNVVSKAYGSNEAYSWTSSGIDGFTIIESSKDNYGTDVILTIKEDEECEKYLDEYNIKNLIKKYSDYITYPIKMNVTKSKLKEGSKDEYEDYQEIETINSLVPLWKRNKKDIKEDEYNTFYSDKFFDYEKPLKYLHIAAEGTLEYNALLYIPSHAPYDYYSKEYKKGLQLYSNGVLIMEKCEDLLPDYFSFVKGVVDSPDLSLNISREMLQQTKVLKTIAKNIENRIQKELLDMLENDKENYETFFKAFGNQLKFGIYNSFGMANDFLKDLIMFNSSSSEHLITLKEYVANMKEDQKDIYYACGESVSKVSLLPQVETVKEKGYDVLYLTDYVDEFTLQMLREYDGKKFVNVCNENLDITSSEEKEELKKKNTDNKEMLDFMKEAIGDISEVRFTNKLKNHPVCLSSLGEVSVEMEKVINAMPTDEKIKAQTVLEINENHEIAKTLLDLYKSNKDLLKDYSRILYSQARLIEGLSIENPTEISNLIISSLAKK